MQARMLIVQGWGEGGVELSVAIAECVWFEELAAPCLHVTSHQPFIVHVSMGGKTNIVSEA